eukprot:TRINITY_DN36866_c1_g1_i1.p1 TRINITY_DN36866_c1_g1~~TRINITY_DN36866_c1_g1_i1.p1  ORF type:complete len:100 (+),score=4.23 TRINITY_DN36866_c1_g1_i1:168-467(+)
MLKQTNHNSSWMSRISLSKEWKPVKKGQISSGSLISQRKPTVKLIEQKDRHSALQPICALRFNPKKKSSISQKTFTSEMYQNIKSNKHAWSKLGEVPQK